MKIQLIVERPPRIVSAGGRTMIASSTNPSGESIVHHRPIDRPAFAARFVRGRASEVPYGPRGRLQAVAKSTSRRRSPRETEGRPRFPARRISRTSSFTRCTVPSCQNPYRSSGDQPVGAFRQHVPGSNGSEPQRGQIDMPVSSILRPIRITRRRRWIWRANSNGITRATRISRYATVGATSFTSHAAHGCSSVTMPTARQTGEAIASSISPGMVIAAWRRSAEPAVRRSMGQSSVTAFPIAASDPPATGTDRVRSPETGGSSPASMSRG